MLSETSRKNRTKNILDIPKCRFKLYEYKCNFSGAVSSRRKYDFKIIYTWIWNKFVSVCFLDHFYPPTFHDAIMWHSQYQMSVGW